MLDFCFFDLDFQCPPSLSLLSESGFVLREDVPSCLLNTPPSLLSLPNGLCLSDSDLSRLSLEKTLEKWIKNGAKASIYGFVAIKSAQCSISKKSREKSPSMPLERAQENEFNGAFGSYWASQKNGLKTEQKQVSTGLSRSRVLNVQYQRKVVKSPRACHWRERKKMSSTVPSDLIGPASNPLNGPDQPKLVKAQKNENNKIDDDDVTLHHGHMPIN
nr:hypothetical protein [Tanacetum cinerariifolium]